ncbi:MAG: 3-oxoacyl-ACP synthase [Peptococcaceae bacterium]|jgi:3-oxoacyl-[acyl-carrier-protein] synthase-3|nr:3-oxoacyl-ACP synthase [Peptococcaceae bacterium]
MNNSPAIGIVSTGLYLPKHRITAAEIAGLSGIPVEIVRDKMGINQKPVPGPEDHTCQMGIRAARQALERARFDPSLIDVVIYTGEEHKEYPLWTAGIKLQHEIGARRAWSFDVQLRCGTNIMALKLAKSLMLADPAINAVLLAGGYRNCDLVDYTNPRSRFLYNLAAGGAAILLQKGHPLNQVLETAVITDGSFSEDVIIPAGGTKVPIDHAALDGRLNYLDVPDPAGMKERLEKLSLQNFVNVVRSAVERSNYRVEDISYLAILHMKYSAHRQVLEELGLSEEQAVYLNDYGHIGQMDQILSLNLALERKVIKNGDLVVMVSAGIGYAWDACAVKWGA